MVRLTYFLYLCFGWLYLSAFNLTAQTDTIFLCNPGERVELNAPPGFYAYEWTPEWKLDNPTIANPIASPNSTITYVVRMIPDLSGVNLIVNPDFSDGNTGFLSDYTFVDIIVTQGVYGVDDSAADLNGIFFSDCPDHTDGSGNMLIVDGSPIPNERVWCQTIDVQPATNYAFSTWLTSVKNNNPALLQFYINEVPIGDIFKASETVCEWRQFFEVWQSETATRAEICIINRNTNPDGNDFALDDFAFFEIPNALYDTTVVIMESVESAKERPVYFPSAFSPNQDGINDLFTPYAGKGVLLIKSFQIFNRWGDLLFRQENCTPNDLDCGWDGTFRGKSLNPGTYLFFAEVVFADFQSTLVKGEFLLIR